MKTCRSHARTNAIVFIYKHANYLSIIHIIIITVNNVNILLVRDREHACALVV